MHFCSLPCRCALWFLCSFGFHQCFNFAKQGCDLKNTKFYDYFAQCNRIQYSGKILQFKKKIRNYSRIRKYFEMNIPSGPVVTTSECASASLVNVRVVRL